MDKKPSVCFLYGMVLLMCGGKQEEEDAGEGDKEDTEKKDEVAVLVSGSES